MVDMGNKERYCEVCKKVPIEVNHDSKWEITPEQEIERALTYSTKGVVVDHTFNKNGEMEEVIANYIDTELLEEYRLSWAFDSRYTFKLLGYNLEYNVSCGFLKYAGVEYFFQFDNEKIKYKVVENINYL